MIIIIDHYTPILRIVSADHSASNVTVTVEWTHQAYARYDVTVVPAVSIVITGSTRRQLTIPYNVNHTLTVEATTPCRPNTTTALIRLKYGENVGKLAIIIPHSNGGTLQPLVILIIAI